LTKIGKKKKYFEAAIAIAVALAFILPSSAVIANNTTQQNNPVLNKIKDYKVIKPTVGTKADNILVSNSQGDDIIPGITKDGAGNTVVTWTNEQDILTWNMGIAYSATPTDPVSWTGYIITLTGTTMVYSSDTSYVIGPEPTDYKGLFGVDMYYDTEQVGFYQIADITTDPSTWLFYYWTDPALNPTYATIEDCGYYSEPYNGNRGPANMYIYHWNDLGYDIQDCPMYYITNIEVGGATMFFDAQSHLRTAPAKDPAMAMLPDWFHVAWEYHNATTDTDQIVWKKMDATVEADIEFTPYQKYVADGTNPEIAAFQAGSAYNVAIVYVDGSNVKCVYSADDGTTWSSPVTVAAGSYPALCVIGTKLYCAYIDGGNLFLKTSENGGETWSAAEQINDEPGTVSAEENSVDIHSAGIVWVDTRGADKEIYYAAVPGVENNPPGAPSIDGPASVKRKVKIDYTLNAVDPEGDDVYYYVDWGDTTNSGWVGSSASGVDVIVNHTWAKKGTYTVKAKAKDVNDAESDWTTLEVIVPRTVSINNLFLRFFERFPHAFPLLRHLMEA
jgi:hypothetical protein